eukprot:scaffold1239_cov175-Pinguiococcus_pyrenoidosus.AAC.37
MHLACDLPLAFPASYHTPGPARLVVSRVRVASTRLLLLLHQARRLGGQWHAVSLPSGDRLKG